MLPNFKSMRTVPHGEIHGLPDDSMITVSAERVVSLRDDFKKMFPYSAQSTEGIFYVILDSDPGRYLAEFIMKPLGRTDFVHRHRAHAVFLGSVRLGVPANRAKVVWPRRRSLLAGVWHPPNLVPT